MKRIIFAAGGGNDIYSAIAYAKLIRNAIENKIPNEDIVLIGVLGLTPFHASKKLDLSGNYSYVEPEIIVPTKDMCRYIVTKTPKPIHCQESNLPEVIDRALPGAKYFCISPKYPAQHQANVITAYLLQLGFRQNNARIEIVDFGGDILTNGNQPIISPELDAYTLAVSRHLPYDKKVYVLFPGVDGELPKEYLRDCCMNSANSVGIDLREFLPVLKTILSNLDKRPGNTIPNMISVCEGNFKMCVVKKRWKLGKKDINFSNAIALDPDLQDKIWSFDFDHIHTTNLFVKMFDNVDYDLLSLLRSIEKVYASINSGPIIQLSDLYLQYLRLDDNGKWTNRLLQCNSNVMYVNVFPENIHKCEFLQRSIDYDSLYTEYQSSSTIC